MGLPPDACALQVPFELIVVDPDPISRYGYFFIVGSSTMSVNLIEAYSYISKPQTFLCVSYYENLES